MLRLSFWNQVEGKKYAKCRRQDLCIDIDLVDFADFAFDIENIKISFEPLESKSTPRVEERRDACWFFAFLTRINSCGLSRFWIKSWTFCFVNMTVQSVVVWASGWQREKEAFLCFSPGWKHVEGFSVFFLQIGKRVVGKKRSRTNQCERGLSFVETCVAGFLLFSFSPS